MTCPDCGFDRAEGQICGTCIGRAAGGAVAKQLTTIVERLDESNAQAKRIADRLESFVTAMADGNRDEIIDEKDRTPSQRPQPGRGGLIMAMADYWRAVRIQINGL